MSNKIYIDARYGFREDTLENWETINPVLERGEPSIVRDGKDGEWLKIGDGVTAWNDLPYKKGPRGEQGEKGEGADITVDQTFNPESPNAQSGVAVEEAVNKPWKVIEDITLTEAVLEISIPHSKLQGIKELHISALIVPTDITITSQEVAFGRTGKTYWTGKANAKAMGSIKVVMDVYISPRKTVILDGTIASYDYTFSTTTGTSYKSVGEFLTGDMEDGFNVDLSGYNIWMRTTTANLMAVGTRFKVWGR
jgi:hypothetical protein